MVQPRPEYLAGNRCGTGISVNTQNLNCYTKWERIFFKFDIYAYRALINSFEYINFEKRNSGKLRPEIQWYPFSVSGIAGTGISF